MASLQWDVYFYLNLSHSYIAAAERSEGGRGHYNPRAPNNLVV